MDFCVYNFVQSLCCFFDHWVTTADTFTKNDFPAEADDRCFVPSVGGMLHTDIQLTHRPFLLDDLCPFEVRC